MKLRDEVVEDFFRFIVKRHEAYHNRFVLRLPPPWTDDLIIRKYRFCNVYRELDKGTLYVINNLVPYARSVSPVDFPDDRSWRVQANFVFNVITYRKFNWPLTHEALAEAFGNYSDCRHIMVHWDEHHAFKLLEKFKKNQKVQSNAFTLVAQGGTLANRLKGITEIWKRKEQITTDLRNASTLREAFNVIEALPQLGGFMAYEIVIDLNYAQTVVAYSENDFVNAGPGCIRGLNLMIVRDDRGVYKYVDAMQELWSRQRDELERTRLRVTLDKKLTLRNIEHSLCEYFKYVRIKNGGHAKFGFSEVEAYKADNA